MALVVCFQTNETDFILTCTCRLEISRAFNLSTQVVTAIYDISNPGEAVNLSGNSTTLVLHIMTITDIGLRMT